MDRSQVGGRVRGFLGFKSAIRWVSLAVCTASASWAVSLVHRPYLQNVREDRATVIWSTMENVGATVQYSPDQQFSTIRSAPVRTRAFTSSQTSWIAFYQHRAELTGLAAGTEYAYRIIMDGQNLSPEADHRFRTMSRSEPFRFLVFGDSGSGSPTQQAMSKVMAKEQPDFVLHTGDIAYEEGTFQQFHANYFEYYWPIMRRAPFFPAPGNHEYYTLNAQPYLDLHSLPSETVPSTDAGRYYSFDWGNVHFVALDSNLLERGAGKRMLEWIEQDLAVATAPWKVAYFHHVPYPLEHHLDDPLTRIAEQQIVPVLERYGVQLVLTGHEHIYLRTRPLRSGVPAASGPATTYISTGGGGAVEHGATVRAAFAARVARSAAVYHFLRVEAEPSQLTVRALDQEGKEFDRTVLARPVFSEGEDAIVNGASFTSSLAPGGIVTIFGQGLATGASQAATIPLPRAVLGSTVMLNGEPLPLYYASATQINALLPMEVQGTAVLRVLTQSGTAERMVDISEAAPAIFSRGIRHADGALVTPERPAFAGETLVIYATGLGRIDSVLAAGEAAPDAPLTRCLAPVSVQIGGLTVAPDFAGLAPRWVGLYQVNLKLPPELPAVVYPLRIRANGNFSDAVSLPVASR